MKLSSTPIVFEPESIFAVVTYSDVPSKAYLHVCSRCAKSTIQYGKYIDLIDSVI